MLFLLACTPDVEDSPVPKESEPIPVDTQDTEPPAPPEGTVAGSMALEDGQTASVVGWHAFSYVNENAGFVYISGNMNATCSDLEGWFLRQEDPTSLFEPGTCNLQIAAPDGFPLDFSLPATTTATIQLQCPFGSGSFALSDGAYQWSGDWWVGAADGGTVSITASGTTASGTLDLTSFNGSYPYEAGAPAARATGSITGSVFGEPCEGLAAHPYFQ